MIIPVYTEKSKQGKKGEGEKKKEKPKSGYFKTKLCYLN